MDSSSGAYSPSTPNTSGTGHAFHKNSLKGITLARRARSFKDDLFEKISQMRTPTNTLGRSHSPHSPRTKHGKGHFHENGKTASESLDTHLRDIRNALKHIRDVISKRKLEVMTENGKMILELIASMFTSIQGYTLNENSSVLISARTQVYLALGRLIKLCDEILLWEEESECTALNKENVKEIIELLDSAVENLVNVAKEKIKEKESSQNAGSASPNHLMRPTVDVAGQRTSLPDIPLTPRERDILEKSLSNPVRVTHSTESILRDSSPPPKPPLPVRSSNPPPLPPKRRTQPSELFSSDLVYNPDLSIVGSTGSDYISLMSKSPDDNTSLLSASEGSIDSALNQSREEEELTALPIDTSLDDFDKMFAMKSNTNKRDFDKSIPSTEKNNRNSNESGIGSCQSIRTSTQSISTKRSSEQSHKSLTSNMDSLMKLQSVSFGDDSFEQNSHISGIHLRHEQSSFSYSSSSISSNNASLSITEQNSFKSATQIQSNSSIRVMQENSTDFNKSIDNTDFVDMSALDILVPPKLPAKTKAPGSLSCKYVHQLNNFEETDHLSCDMQSDELPEIRHHQLPNTWQTKHQSLMDPRSMAELPPPLPMKKKQKYIIAYMEICSSSARTNEHLRHSVHTSNMSHSPEHFGSHRNISHSQTMNLSQIREQLPSQCSFLSSPLDEKPPALPPKKHKVTPPTIITTPPPSPKPTFDGYENRRIISSSQGDMTTVNEETQEDDSRPTNGVVINDESKGFQENHTNSICTDDEVVLRNNQYNSKEKSPSHTSDKNDLYVDLNGSNILEQIDISKYLVYKKEGEEGPAIKGGHIDALLVHASRENVFGEAFVTTFRTFIQPIEIVQRLIQRYLLFSCHAADHKRKAAKESFSLLVRVVDDLASTDLSTELLAILVDFVNQLLCSGELQQGKALHSKFVDKVTTYKKMKCSAVNPNEQRSIIINQPTLLILKPQDIAEQMTLLDAELFQKIEIPEVLLFVKEQCEEKSPNLNKFTEHFNKMSYWARTQILIQQDAKEREKYVTKFLKIMTFLRKMNNYNSFLALLSALDSAPIRRLEWNKKITESLKEYCALIDSSSSFRVYRQALADTSPPCIPYIGLVLQDLTFVHVGNPDFLKEGVINFSKRWQQYNIIDNMKRFKKCDYLFRRNEEIINFFDNFEYSFDEEQMWQISEYIKPRGRKIAQN